MANFGTGFALGLGTMSRAIEGGHQLKIQEDENAQRQKLYGREQADHEFTTGLHDIQGKVLSGELDPDTLQPRAQPAPATSPDGLAQQPVPWKDTRTPEQKQLDVLRATERYAEGKGKGSTALQAFQMSLPIKEQLREKDFSQSWVNFKTTGNVQPLMDYANRYVPDGIRFEGATPIAGQDGKITGYKIAATQNGQPLPIQDVPVDQVEGLFRAYASPQNAWAADIERVKSLREVAQEGAVALAKEGAKNGGLFELKPGSSYRDPRTGTVYQGTDYKTVKGADGSESVVAVPTGPGQAGGGVVAAGGPSKPSVALTETERKWEKNANDAIAQASGILLGQVSLPEDRARVSAAMLKAQSYVGQLILANRQELTAGNITEGMLAKVATDLASGALAPVKRGITDRDGKVVAEVDAVKLPNGGFLYLNPDQINAADRRLSQGAPANKPAGDTKGGQTSPGRDLPPAAKVAQDNTNSPQTKAARIQLFETELAAEQAKPESPERNANIAGLQKELNAARKSFSAPAAAQPAQPAAAQPAGLTPVQTEAKPKEPAAKVATMTDAQLRELAKAPVRGRPANPLRDAALAELDTRAQKWRDEAIRKRQAERAGAGLNPIPAVAAR